MKRAGKVCYLVERYTLTHSLLLTHNNTHTRTGGGWHIRLNIGHSIRIPREGKEGEKVRRIFRAYFWIRNKSFMLEGED